MSDNHDNIMDELLVKVMLNEASEGEQQLVQDWLQADKHNAGYYEHFKIIWEESLQIRTKTAPDENIAWTKLQQRIQNASKAPVNVRFLSPFLKLRSVAAIFILVVATVTVSYLLTSRLGGHKLRVTQTGNFTKIDTLSDGSVITLNRNSVVTYQQEFDGEQRNVQLKGEAFFSVVPDEQKPFTVTTDNASVLVTGTSFNVSTTGGKTQVIVETGRVQVSNTKKNIVLEPGEKVTVAKNDTALEKQVISNHLYNYYRTKLFVCHNTPLRELSQTLNIAYGVNITIPNQQTQSLQLNTTFREASLDTILNIICKTFDLTTQRKGSIIILK